MLNNLKDLFTISHDPMAILDLKGDFKQVNPAFSRILGWETVELIGRNFRDMIVITGQQQVDLSRVILNLSKGYPIFFVDGQFEHKNGKMHHLRWTAYPDLGKGIIILVFRAPTKLGENQDLLKLAVEVSPTVILIVFNEIIIFANRLMETVFGYSKEELIGKPVETLVPTILQTIQRSYYDRCNQEPYLQPIGTALDLVGLRKDGTEFPVAIGFNPIQTANGLVVVCSVIDLSKRKETDEITAHKIQNLVNKVARLDKLSKTDELTLIKNRRAMDIQLELQYHTAQTNGEVLSFILLDIDNFKHYNDAFGHLAGDEVLKFIARIMTSSLRHTETIARYGGEEFGVILPGNNAENAMHTAERLRKAIEEFECPFQRITVSLGCATVFPKTNQTFNPENIKNIIRMADKALYQSKSSGKNRATHYDQLAINPEEKLSDWNIKYETPTDH